MATPATPGSSALPGPSTSKPTDGSANSEMGMFMGFVKVLEEPNAKDDVKWKAALELSKHLETILNSPLYPAFLEHSIRTFLKVLQESEPHFISQYSLQQMRKYVLEILHRLPTNELLRPYVKPILSLMLKLLTVDNEENVLICLRIIIELHKQYRPPFSPEVQHFLHFVKGIYQRLPEHLPRIFEPRPESIICNTLSDLNIEDLLKQTFTTTMIKEEAQLDKYGIPVTYTLIPCATLSLKVIYSRKKTENRK